MSHDFLEGIHRGFKGQADRLSAGLPSKQTHLDKRFFIENELVHAQLAMRGTGSESEKIGQNVFVFCMKLLGIADKHEGFVCDQDSFTIIQETFNEELAELLIELDLA